MEVSLRKILESHGNDNLTKDNIITDGTHSCSYASLIQKFEQLSDIFGSSSIFEGTVAYFFDNTLQSAVFLLWLLVENKSFILVSSENKTAFQEQKIRFYRYGISVSKQLFESDFFIDKSFIDLDRNPKYAEYGRFEKNGSLFFLTSGSTKSPKVAQHSIERVLQNSENCSDHLGISVTDRVLIPVPIYHMYGFGAAFLPAIMKGCSVRLVNKTNIIKYISAEASFVPNVAFVTPTLSKMLIRLRRNAQKYRLVVSAGDRMDEHLFIDAENKLGRMINLYGSTELGVIATSPVNGDIADKKDGSLICLNHVLLRFDGFESKIATQQAVKEISCKHSFGFDRYVDSKGVSLQTGNLIDGWFRISDICLQKADRSFILLGRKEQSVNRNGILVAFSEIEENVRAIDARIEQVVVYALDEETKRGKRLVAFCVGHMLSDSDATEIRKQCLTLNSKLIPDEIKIIASAPLLPNGKTDRVALQKHI